MWGGRGVCLLPGIVCPWNCLSLEPPAPTRPLGCAAPSRPLLRLSQDGDTRTWNTGIGTGAVPSAGSAAEAAEPRRPGDPPGNWRCDACHCHSRWPRWHCHLLRAARAASARSSKRSAARIPFPILIEIPTSLTRARKKADLRAGNVGVSLDVTCALTAALSQAELCTSLGYQSGCADSDPCPAPDFPGI